MSISKSLTFLFVLAFSTFWLLLGFSTVMTSPFWGLLALAFGSYGLNLMYKIVTEPIRFG